ncbi:YicC family protein [Bacillus sp. FJAT-29790]|uniref:YicC/YloC family endoribonuclease n=1 Tax=Bacillus sp. FJAT-29790 TaxID=1895002 RepID=UPI001C22EF47|nr:YicC/YloC family endoribonuclease [Bacillus sp. FJAT-29790]MBU8877768.1 YicC family protein [Bacillus sp. FJAT-29790]
MVESMTGFGSSKKESGSFSALVEIRTVNHRFSEYQIRMPRQLLRIEDKMKKKLGQYIQRGRIEVYVTVEGEGMMNRQIRVDWALLDEYVQSVKRIKDKYSIRNEMTFQDVMREELIAIEEKETANEEIERIVLSALNEACVQLKQMRIMEGGELEKDVNHHLNRLSMRAAELRVYAKEVVRHYQERLTKRMTDFLNGQLDEARILTEVAIFADKADINEELTRLQSHIKQFVITLQGKEPIGRKLDFLLQEMNREVNTIGSKANDSKVASEVVEMKSLLEKMKEQVQNIE